MRDATNQRISQDQRKARSQGDDGDHQDVQGQRGLPAACDPQSHCPIRQNAQAIDQLSSDMVKTLRNLRRDLENCSHCTPNCPFLREYNATVSAALVRIAEEWQLQV